MASSHRDGRASGPEILGIVGSGVMGQGIAQAAIQNGIQVRFHDAAPAALENAVSRVLSRIDRLAEKAELNEISATDAKRRLRATSALSELGACDVVIEAITEDINEKRTLFSSLENVVGATAILASNTSSLTISSLARGCQHPERIAGMHFFNPVPLMQIVEVIQGVATAEGTVAALCELSRRLGKTPVRVKDSPGFLVNFCGRAFTTEALAILSEGVASPAAVDEVMRDCWGYRMGPIELLDFTGIDVNFPANQFIHASFGGDPRFRTRPIHGVLFEAGRFGRKTGIGFYRYENSEPRHGDQIPAAHGAPRQVVNADASAFIASLCGNAGVRVLDRDDGKSPLLCAPVGQDCSTTAFDKGFDHRRLVAIDPLGNSSKRVTVMTAPGCDPDVGSSVVGLCNRSGRAVTRIKDSPGFIGQRISAMVANLGCEAAQIGVAPAADIDEAVELGLRYPFGPLKLCDEIGPSRVYRILESLQGATGDDRYRPSLWLRRRAQLGLSATTPES